MNIRKRFSPNPLKKFECDSYKLRKSINRWVRKKGWKYEDFYDFLELVGVETPVSLSEFNENKNTFKCRTACDSEIMIEISRDDYVFGHSISVVTKNEARTYIIERKDAKHKRPSATLVFKQIKENGERYHFFANGDWEYISDDGIIIKYYKVSKEYIFSVTDENRMVEVENLRKIMNRVKAQL